MSAEDIASMGDAARIELETVKDAPEEYFRKILTRPKAELAEEFEATWKSADTNGDGFLNEAEFVDMYEKHCSNEEAYTGFKPPMTEDISKTCYAAMVAVEKNDAGISKQFFT